MLSPCWHILAVTSWVAVISGIGGEMFNSTLCRLEPKTGRCRGRNERWYYNSTTGNCDTFNWGGCDENENNFVNCTQCMKRCSSHGDARNDTSIEALCLEIETKLDEEYWGGFDPNQGTADNSSSSYYFTEEDYER